MILGRVVKMSDLDESKRNDLAGLPFYRLPPLSQRRLWPFMGIPAINTLSVTPLNAFLAKAAVFNNPWETSRPISTLTPPLFQPIDRTVERKKKSRTIAGNAALRLFFTEVFTSSLEIPCNFVTAFLTYVYFFKVFLWPRWIKKKKKKPRTLASVLETIATRIPMFGQLYWPWKLF